MKIIFYDEDMQKALMEDCEFKHNTLSNKIIKSEWKDYEEYDCLKVEYVKEAIRKLIQETETEDLIDYIETGEMAYNPTKFESKIKEIFGEELL